MSRTAGLPSLDQTLDDLDAPDAAASLAQRVSPGGCGNLMLDEIAERMEGLRE